MDILKNILQRILNLTTIIMKSVLSFMFFIFFIAGIGFIIYTAEMDMLKVFYIFFNLLILLYSNWAIWHKGILNKVVIVILLLAWYNLPPLNVKLEMQYELNVDTCFDDGWCVEGVMMPTGNGKVKMDKNFCEKNDWTWFEEYKTCNTRDSQLKVRRKKKL